MPGQHSILAASAAHRWLNCTPSVKLCEQFPSGTSIYAEEGTRAHTVCAYKLGELVHKPQPAPDFEVDEATAQYADAYVAFVAEHIKPGAVVLIEQRVRYGKWAEGGFGTADCIVLHDGTMHIIDYKHGMGVPVSAENNPQLKLYALGALEAFKFLFDITSVELSIFQPRISNTNSWSVSVEDLLSWAEEEVKPKAKLAAAGEGEFCAGAHCQFCAAKNICRARAEANLLQCKKDFALPPTLDNEEIAVLLPKLDEIIAWASDVKTYALESALQGEHYDGYKLVNGRSVRKYTDEKAVADTVKNAGFNPYKQEVLGVTAMTKLLGAQRFKELLGDLVSKAPGKPTLVPDTDKRPAINDAASEFAAVVNN